MNIDRIQEKEMGRFMRMKHRLIYEGATYHITQRAPGNEVIFIEDSDYLKFVGILKFVARKYCLSIYAFALLPNHLHLLLRITTKNLSVAMKFLFESYARYFNDKYERKGHVFCGVFRSSTCFDDNYFLTASVYIHLNAVRAGCADRIDHYRWHSVQLYVQHEAPKSFVEPERILSLLSHDEDEARELYKKILDVSLNLKPGASTQHKLVDINIRRGISIVVDLLSRHRRKCENLENVAFSANQGYLVSQLLSNGCSAEEIQQKLGVSRATYYRLLGKRRSETFGLKPKVSK